MTRLSLRHLLLSLILLPFSWALKFDVAAHTGRERCIRNFVAKDTLVLVTAIVDGQKGDGQQVNMHVGLSLSLSFWVVANHTLQGTHTHTSLVLTPCFASACLDQGCRRQRIRAAEGYRGGDEDGVHVARGRGV